MEYSDNYSKTSESLRQYDKDEPNNNLADCTIKILKQFLENAVKIGKLILF